MSNSNTSAAKGKDRGTRQAGKLKRTAFSTSRLAEFCSEKELTNQTGHGPDEWPLVILKELVDNALDDCEETDTAPAVEVVVTTDSITVTDNGPGIPAATLEGIRDFSVRVSSREAYVSPTRGAQGNALKTILAMPFVLDGAQGRVDVSAHGQRHEIIFGVDKIRQEPTIRHTAHPDRKVRNGTRVTIHWPNLACSILTDAGPRFLQLADAYMWLNPHLSFTVEWFGQRRKTEATSAKWQKWLPSEPTSAYWYGSEEFERQVSAYIAYDRDHGADRLVTELLKEFRGLTGTAKQKIVLEETGLSRKNLSALANGDGLQHDTLAKLLASIQKQSKPVKPAALGIIGEAHIRQRMEEAGCQMETFSYKKVAEVDSDGLPMVIETAFGWRGDDCEESRRLITGINWSPAIGNPFRTLGNDYGDGLAALLEKQRAGAHEPIIFLLHVAHPRVRYTDRGKSAVVMK
jgi:DNA topoisomerase VI subunit B